MGKIQAFSLWPVQEVYFEYRYGHHGEEIRHYPKVSIPFGYDTPSFLAID